MSRAASDFLSIVIPCFNEAAVFPRLREALVHLANSMAMPVEIILVDDGSRDDTWSAIEAFAHDDQRVNGVRLSRNFGHQFALTCGYDLARGAAVVSMDADLQDPPEVVHEMVRRWQEGNDIVLAVRRLRHGEGWYKRGTAALFYRLIISLGAREVRADTGDFRLMSRAALNALSGMREPHRFIRGMVGWIGFRTTEIHFDRPARAAGETKYPFRRMLGLAVDAIISFSSAPLRAAYWAALSLLLLSFGYLGYVIVMWIFFGVELVKGWSSLLAATVAFGTVNLICLGLIGEYIGRIYEQGKHRPLYLVQDRVGKMSERSTVGPTAS